MASVVVVARPEFHFLQPKCNNEIANLWLSQPRPSLRTLWKSVGSPLSAVGTGGSTVPQKMSSVPLLLFWLIFPDSKRDFSKAEKWTEFWLYQDRNLILRTQEKVELTAKCQHYGRCSFSLDWSRKIEGANLILRDRGTLLAWFISRDFSGRHRFNFSTLGVARPKWHLQLRAPSNILSIFILCGQNERVKYWIDREILARVCSKIRY